jgi:hypothetical protein
MKTIEITVSPTGETTVQTKGFTGSACQDASKFIEQALGERSGEQLTVVGDLDGTAVKAQKPPHN